jgi:hypothetical protein
MLLRHTGLTFAGRFERWGDTWRRGSGASSPDYVLVVIFASVDGINWVSYVGSLMQRRNALNGFDLHTFGDGGEDMVEGLNGSLHRFEVIAC